MLTKVRLALYLLFFSLVIVAMLGPRTYVQLLQQASTVTVTLGHSYDNNHPTEEQPGIPIAMRKPSQNPRFLMDNHKKKRPKVPDEVLFANEHSWDHPKLRCSQNATRHRSQPLSVFWVNLDKAHKRKKIFQRQLERLGFRNQRISAVSPDSPIKFIRQIEPAIQETPTERSCLTSHLLAIYAAVHDDSLTPQSPYALIIEDDVVLELDVNFTAMAESAPRDFGILQLMTSHAHQVQKNWEKYRHASSKAFEDAAKAATARSNSIGNANAQTNAMDPNVSVTFEKPVPWTRWAQPDGLWSTQAYLINKARIAAFIDDIVTLSDGARPRDLAFNSSHGKTTIRMGSPNEKQFPCRGSGLNKRCDFPWRPVADYFLYIGGGPTYLAQIPVFNGAKVRSTIHEHHGRSHAAQFDEIGQTVESAKRHAFLLPPWVQPFPTCSSEGSAGVNMSIASTRSTSTSPRPMTLAAQVKPKAKNRIAERLAAPLKLKINSNEI